MVLRFSPVVLFAGWRWRQDVSSAFLSGDYRSRRSLAAEELQQVVGQTP